MFADANEKGVLHPAQSITLEGELPTVEQRVPLSLIINLKISC
jgi:hypothetical protein